MNIISIISIIIINIVAILFWVWFLGKVTKNTRFGWKMILYLGILSTVFLLLYGQFSKYINIWGNYGGYILLWIFIIVWLYISYIIINKKINISYAIRVMISSLMGFASLFVGGAVWQAAWSEEITKFFSANSIYDKYKYVSSDILIFTIMSGIGFGFIENMIYLARTVINDKQVIMIGISRLIMIYVAHIFFTGIAWYGSYIDAKSKNWFYFVSVLALLIWAAIHTIYNNILNNAHIIIVLIMICLSYLFVAYIFYRSDRLFIQDR